MMTNCAAVPVCDLALGIAIWKAAGGGGGGMGVCVCQQYSFDFTAFSLLQAFA